ncbi:hypothetical protein FRB97_008277 [Tulasnella sp. 331]|nr:hypothetical protein FRB97_008277 [Tulasnella sp. 331]
MAKLSGYSGTSVLLPHGATHKMARKLFAQVLHPHIVERDFAPVQGRLMLQLVKALIEDPDNHKRHIRRSIAEVLQAITYGNCSDDDGTDLVDLNNNAVMNLGKALTGYTVDILPWLKYIPEWIPGTQFHRDARAFREFMELALSQPLNMVKRQFHRDARAFWVLMELALSQPKNMVKRQVADGTAPPSFVSSLLEADEDERSSDDFIAWAGFSMFGGGSDTTVATLETFMLAMTLYPDVQSKARQELDSVVRGRLPTISDKDSTPYLNAVILETLRWHPVVPAGVPHRLMRDDFYKGYSIPAGTIVFVNAWGILHDEHQFPDPFTFDPSRFLSETATINGSETAPLNPRSVGFGYGTRSCQGIAVVESALWIAMSTILYSLEIRKKVDPQTGQAIVPNVRWEGDAISYVIYSAQAWT